MTKDSKVLGVAMVAATQAKLERDERIIEEALSILERRMRVDVELNVADDLVRYLRLKLGGLEYEAFYVIYVDMQNMVLHHEQLFKGTIDSSHVYPREVMREVFKHNASGIIIAHNHPGGTPQPSPSDYAMTKNLGKALSYIGVRLLDHVVITGTSSYSMQAMGTLPSVK